MTPTPPRWNLRTTDADIPLMCRVLGIAGPTAQVLAHRGLRSKKTAQAFLHPLAAPAWHNTLDMHGAPAALARLAQAIGSGEPLVIFGDYDVDGVCATVIMYKVLRRLGANASYYIPHRVDEGYGLNHGAVQALADQGARQLVCVDNGISAVEEIAAANALGMEVLIIDHHEPGDTLPPACAIVDPKLPDCAYPFAELCAAGLAFKLAAALCAQLGDPFPEEQELCALVAMATLCDLVPLVDENRLLVARGLAALDANKLINPGLGSLITRRGYLDKPIDSHAVGFVLGPCLNATGRLGHATEAVALLLETDPARRLALAQQLCDMNDARKTLTAQSTERVLAQVQALPALPSVLVLSDDTAHESVAGIVAGRVREATGRPTVVLTPGDGAYKGSGRSIPAYNMHQALHAHRELLTRFGGHYMAAGLTLPGQSIPLLRDALNRDCTLLPEDFVPTLDIDATLAPGDITLALAQELTRLAPFGKGNPEPLFVTYGLPATHVRVLDNKNTLIFTFGKLKGIAFGLNQVYAHAIAAADVPPTGGFVMDVAFTPEINVYNGRTSVQMRVRDFCIVTEPT